MIKQVYLKVNANIGMLFALLDLIEKYELDMHMVTHSKIGKERKLILTFTRYATLITIYYSYFFHQSVIYEVDIVNMSIEIIILFFGM